MGLGERLITRVIYVCLADNGFVVSRESSGHLNVVAPSGLLYDVTVTRRYPELDKHGSSVVTSPHASIGDSIAAATESLSQDRFTD